MEYKNESFKFTKAIIYTFDDIPLERPFYDGTHGPHLNLPVKNWLELYDENGIIGNCPCSSIMRNLILPMLLTGKTETYNEIYDRIYWNIRNNGFASESYAELGRLDLALFDIIAKRAGKPLHRFLGAKKDSVKVYASGCGTGLTDKELVEEAERYVDMGYDLIKMKIAMESGSETDRDIYRISLVRKALGDNIKIAIDANQCWDSQDALEFIKRVEQYKIEWFEEPVHSMNFKEIEKICSLSPVPIAMGESLRSKYLFEMYAQKGVHHLQPVWSNMGKISDVFEVADLADKNNLFLSLGGLTHITAALSAVCNDSVITEYLEPLFKPFGDIMSVKPEESDGRFYLPLISGLPVKLDLNLMEKLRLILKKEFFYPGKI